MKKLFTLCTALMLGLGAFSQVDETFQFIDANGDVVADGSTIVINQLNDNGQMVIPLSVKNVSGEKAAVSMYETIDNMPNGEWQTCAFGNCMMLMESGYSPKNIASADYNASIQTEWIPEQGQYATWEATLQIHVFNIKQQSKFGQMIEVAGDEIEGYGPTVTVRFEYKDATLPDEGQKVWWGYVSEKDNDNSVGVSKAETYDCAVFYPGDNETAAGKTIHAVRFLLYSQNVKDVKVWIANSLPTSIDGKSRTVIDMVNVEKPVSGMNEVELSEPYKIGDKGVYVGYSFTITKIQYQSDAYPVPTVGTDMKNALILRTSASVTSWEDLYGNGFGRLFLQVLLGGDFPYKNAAKPLDFGPIIIPFGTSQPNTVNIQNLGTEGISDISYVISANGQAGEEKTLHLPQAYNSYTGITSVSIPFESADTEGTEERTLTITKVNGQPNEATEASASGLVSSTSQTVQKRVVVEEFTGTGCGYCPRGIVSMENMRKRFGDSFIGIALHQYNTSDAMYIAPSKYASLSFQGAPSSRVNRTDEVDPYYYAPDVVATMLNETALAGITVKGTWADDTQKKVDATAKITTLIDGADYNIEYVLVGDGLSGTGSGWNQSNYYYSETNLPEDLAPFGKGGKYGKSSVSGLTFNDVALASSYTNSKNQASPVIGTKMSEDAVNTFTLTMPTKTTLLNGIDKEQVYVVALLIGDDGTIINAAKALVTDAINGDVNGDHTVDVADISAIISVMAGSASYENADVNGDGIVDVADISTVISIMSATSRIQ